MRLLAPLLVLVGCEGLTTEQCVGRPWDGGGSLIDAGASIDPGAGEWIADLDDASVDVARVDFTEASCFGDEWSVTTDADAGEADEVRAGVWNLRDRDFGEAVALEATDEGWAGDVPGACVAEAATTVVAMPVAGGVWGRPEGSTAGAITGYGTVNGSGAATNVEVYTDGRPDLVELLVIDLENGTAAGPTALVRDGDTALGQPKWIVPEPDRVCREDGDFLLFGFIASAKDAVIGAWAL